MLEDILWLVAIYFLYRFVFELVIPIARTVSKMKTTVSQMNEQQQQFTKTQSTQQSTVPPKSSTTSTNDEYIEFEEIKD
jgi:hypothetical protein